MFDSNNIPRSEHDMVVMSNLTLSYGWKACYFAYIDCFQNKMKGAKTLFAISYWLIPGYLLSLKSMFSINSKSIKPSQYPTNLLCSRHIDTL